MLEIVLLHRLCKVVGQLSRTKGLPVLWFQALMIAAWFGGEVYGGVTTAMLTAIAAPPGHHEAPLGLMYASALIGGGCAAAVIFGLAWMLPAQRRVIATRSCVGCGEPNSEPTVACPMCGCAQLVPLRSAA